MSENREEFKSTRVNCEDSLEQIVADLRLARLDWRRTQGKSDVYRREIPSSDSLKEFVKDISGVLFPMRLGPLDLCEDAEDHYVGFTLSSALNVLRSQIALELAIREPKSPVLEKARSLGSQFASSLPSLRRILDQDVLAAFYGDPAARNTDEVLACYPGTHALILHRIAHKLHDLGLPLIARIISEIAHSETGIDIHPGAQIGPGCFIDHGTGVVIGETAIVGSNVRIYQAVTLGAKSFPKEEDGTLQKGLQRHPIVEDDVVIYAGATILGRIVIGKSSIIGGNVWITQNVPESSVITQASLTQNSGSLAHA